MSEVSPAPFTLATTPTNQAPVLKTEGGVPGVSHRISTYLTVLPAICQPPGVVVGDVLLLCARNGIVVLGHCHGVLCEDDTGSIQKTLPKNGYECGHWRETQVPTHGLTVSLAEQTPPGRRPAEHLQLVTGLDEDRAGRYVWVQIDDITTHWGAETIQGTLSREFLKYSL